MPRIEARADTTPPALSPDRAQAAAAPHAPHVPHVPRVPHAPHAPHAPNEAPARRWRSSELLGARQEIEIEHGAITYRLRLTSLGKLILTK